MAEHHYEHERCICCNHILKSSVVITETLKAGDRVVPTEECLKILGDKQNALYNAVVAIDPITDILTLHCIDGAHARISSYWVKLVKG